MVLKKGIQDRFKYFFNVKVTKNSFTMIFISIVGYFVWLFAFPMFGPITDNLLVGLKALAIEKGRFVQLFLISMIVSSFISGYLIDKVEKRIVFIWVPTIMASLLTFAFVWLNKISEVFLFSFLLGIAAGVSPAAWGAFFADHTSPEDRGRTMGISIGFSMPIAYLFFITEPFEIGGTAKAELLIIGSLYLVTLLTFFLRPQEKTQVITSSKGRRGAGFRQLFFYSIPIFLFYWVMGVLLSIVFPTVQDQVRTEIFYLIWTFPFLFGAISAGVLFDTMGRNFPTIVGLAITGVSLAVLGIFGIRLGYVCITTLAIGCSFVTVFSFIVWADLAPANARGTYYGAGTGLMASAILLGLMSAGTLFGSISASQIKSYILLSSVALFLCIPPLIITEDVLPKELIEKRRFQQYLDQARKKYVKKG